MTGRRGRPRKDPSAPLPELMGLVQLIAWMRSYRGEGMSPAKIHRLIATEAFPAHEDLSTRTRKGEPRLVFKRGEVQTWFEARLRRVTPRTVSALRTA